MLLVAPGYTYSLFFSFWDTSGARTSVDSPIVDIYTPERNPYVDGEALTTTSTTGKYQYNFFAPVGITVGHWYAVGVGLSNNNTLFSEVTPFEVTDPKTDAQWVGFEEFREYVKGFAPKRAAEITWVSADMIEKAAIMYATNGPAAISDHVGVSHTYNGF